MGPNSCQEMWYYKIYKSLNGGQIIPNILSSLEFAAPYSKELFLLRGCIMEKVNLIKIKKCIKCHKNKKYTEFTRDKYRKSGYTSSCKDCRNRKGQPVQYNQTKECNSCFKTKYKKDFSIIATGYIHIDTCKECVIILNTGPVGTKKCSMCKEFKLFEKFGRKKYTLDNLNSSCKECLNSKQKEKYALGNGSRQSNIKYNYNLTLEDYEELLKKQNYGCAICGMTEKELGEYLNVDHDHNCCPGNRSCGECIRGLLCRAHNLMLGYAHDNIKELTAGMKYLETNIIL